MPKSTEIIRIFLSEGLLLWTSCRRFSFGWDIWPKAEPKIFSQICVLQRCMWESHLLSFNQFQNSFCSKASPGSQFVSDVSITVSIDDVGTDDDASCKLKRRSLICCSEKVIWKCPYRYTNEASSEPLMEHGALSPLVGRSWWAALFHFHSSHSRPWGAAELMTPRRRRRKRSEPRKPTRISRGRYKRINRLMTFTKVGQWLRPVKVDRERYRT